MNPQLHDLILFSLCISIIYHNFPITDRNPYQPIDQP